MLLKPSPSSPTPVPGRRRHGRRAHRPTRTSVVFAARRWASSRPLGAGLLLLVAGLVIVLLPGARLTVVLLPGLAGVSGFLFGAGLGVLGLFLWFQPRSHAFAGVSAVLIALASLVTTNLGGFGVGLLLGILGGALGFAWNPEQPPARGTPRPVAGSDGESAAPTDVLPVSPGRPPRRGGEAG